MLVLLRSDWVKRVLSILIDESIDEFIVEWATRRNIYGKGLR